jgi:hypothetical protein
MSFVSFVSGGVGAFSFFSSCGSEVFFEKGPC